MLTDLTFPLHSFFAVQPYETWRQVTLFQLIFSEESEADPFPVLWGCKYHNTTVPVWMKTFLLYCSSKYPWSYERGSIHSIERTWHKNLHTETASWISMQHPKLAENRDHFLLWKWSQKQTTFFKTLRSVFFPPSWKRHLKFYLVLLWCQESPFLFYCLTQNIIMFC